MSDFFEIQNILTLRSDLDLSNKLFIGVLKPQTIPPHLILIHNNLYYDLRLQKTTTAVNFTKFKSKIISGKIPALFFELDARQKLISKEAIINCFENLTFDTAKKTTCLSPIKKTLSDILDIDLMNNSTIFELLEVLRSNNAITNVYHFKSDEIISAGNLKWKKYSTEQLFKGFKDLNTSVNA